MEPKANGAKNSGRSDQVEKRREGMRSKGRGSEKPTALNPGTNRNTGSGENTSDWTRRDVAGGEPGGGAVGSGLGGGADRELVFETDEQVELGAGGVVVAEAFADGAVEAEV